MDDEVEIEGLYLTHTSLALKMSVDMGGRLGVLNVWLPRSEITDYSGFEDYDDLDADDPISVFIPQWLAEQKGLV